MNLQCVPVTNTCMYMLSTHFCERGCDVCTALVGCPHSIHLSVYSCTAAFALAVWSAGGKCEQLVTSAYHPMHAVTLVTYVSLCHYPMHTVTLVTYVSLCHHPMHAVILVTRVIVSPSHACSDTSDIPVIVSLSHACSVTSDIRVIVSPSHACSVTSDTCHCVTIPCMQ